jgi:hypothetical protein
VTSHSGRIVKTTGDGVLGRPASLLVRAEAGDLVFDTEQDKTP